MAAIGFGAVGGVALFVVGGVITAAVAAVVGPHEATHSEP